MKSVPLRGSVWFADISRIAICSQEPHATAQWYWLGFAEKIELNQPTGRET